MTLKIQRTVLSSKLPERIKMMLLAMSILANEDGEGDASQAEIGEAIGCDARSVRRRLATLRGLPWSPVKVDTVHRSRDDGRGRDSDRWQLTTPLLFALPPDPTHEDTKDYLTRHALGLHLAATGGRKPESQPSIIHTLRMLELFGAAPLFTFVAAIKGAPLLCWAECLETGRAEIYLNENDILHWLEAGALPEEPAEQRTRSATGHWWHEPIDSTTVEVSEAAE